MKSTGLAGESRQSVNRPEVAQVTQLENGKSGNGRHTYWRENVVVKMANLLYLALCSLNFHRKNIHKKSGLIGKKTNMRSSLIPMSHFDGINNVGLIRWSFDVKNQYSVRSAELTRPTPSRQLEELRQ